MCERGAVDEPTDESALDAAPAEAAPRNAPARRAPAPWWQRKGPSGLVFVLVLVALVVATVSAVSGVADVLPEVGKDQQGEDPWVDRVGVEKVGIFQIAHIPDCAAAPVVRLELWDEESEPYWQVRGPTTAMSSFAVGATPEGWEVVTPYTEPPADAVLRLVVVRSVKGVAGTRYREADLRSGYVVTGVPPSRFQVADFQGGNFCDDGTEGSSDTTTSTTEGP